MCEKNANYDFRLPDTVIAMAIVSMWLGPIPTSLGDMSYYSSILGHLMQIKFSSLFM